MSIFFGLPSGASPSRVSPTNPYLGSPPRRRGNMTADVISVSAYFCLSSRNTDSREEEAMRYGLALPNGGVCGDARVLAELGCLAEEAGWDGVCVENYIVHQSDGAVPTCDPWIALAA